MREIQYLLPEVTLLSENGIGHTEYAGRIAYNSFKASEHECIRNQDLSKVEDIRNIESSEILNKLAWVHFHHSVLEHSVLTYLIQGISRGVLQELARHRIASYTVRSTRYTMSNILITYLVSTMVSSDTSIVFKYFRNKVLLLDNFVITGEALDLEIKQLFEKLQQSNLKEEDILSKSSLKLVDEMYENIIISDEDIEELYRNLLNGTQKRNVGDNFKHIVTDNWKVDLVMTINLRSLKNFFELRDSGAAYFQIRNLAKAMKASTPSKYLDLIVKKKG